MNVLAFDQGSNVNVGRLRVLALDPGVWCGFAFGVLTKKPYSGLIKLPEGSRGCRACNLEGRVRDLISGCRVEHIVLEDVYLMRDKSRISMDQIKMLHAWRTAIEMAAYKSGLDGNRLTFVKPDQWRKTFGTNDVPPAVRRSRRKDAVRAFKKRAAFERCLEIGWEPKNHDEADALGIWHYLESLLMPVEGLTRTPLFAGLTL